MSPEAQYKYLLGLKSIRDGARVVYESAQKGELTNFEFHAHKLDGVAEFVASLIMQSFAPELFTLIPPHGRWQHFEVKQVPRVDSILKEWRAAGVEELECSRRLVDLFLVSVLLDAGAGDVWRYKEESTGLSLERSEGIAVASLYAFTDGLFCSEGIGLMLTHTDSNGAEITHNRETQQGYAIILGESPPWSPSTSRAVTETERLAIIASRQSVDKTIDVNILWDSLQQLLIPTWPAGRTVFHGQPLGDAWPLQLLSDGSGIQPFHKLTQWLTYSLTVIFERVLGIEWTNKEDLTGLPEYRNGGLYVDMGVLTLKPDVLARGLEASTTGLPQFDATDDVIVEWRAMTVALLDTTLGLVNEKLAAQTEGAAAALSLPQLLEAGTWKAGRELAARHRPATKSSPILILSDGTLF
ncbi:hypothetical protein UA08_03678 [Talaromyces atroroseus]|uniref:Protein urg3 n=1 Tax=Talaromyces atroroseus TaxID=1441469 RepID=A0A225B184_TALAT|nr:hypothetical protein UA08_03678 [Talaromyces atroroseus]OKL61006.1 hypothetical protein UA08_03678 [Talaromyces atroroseus]